MLYATSFERRAVQGIDDVFYHTTVNGHFYDQREVHLRLLRDIARETTWEFKQSEHNK